MIPTLNTNILYAVFPLFADLGYHVLLSFWRCVDTGYTLGCTFALPGMHPLSLPQSELHLNH